MTRPEWICFPRTKKQIESNENHNRASHLSSIWNQSVNPNTFIRLSIVQYEVFFVFKVQIFIEVSKDGKILKIRQSNNYTGLKDVVLNMSHNINKDTLGFFQVKYYSMALYTDEYITSMISEQLLKYIRQLILSYNPQGE